MANIMTRKVNPLIIINKNETDIMFKDYVIKPYDKVTIAAEQVTDFLNSLSEEQRDNIIYTELL